MRDLTAFTLAPALVSVLALLACTTEGPPPAAPTTQSAEQSCPLGVRGAVATARETDWGVEIAFTATGASLPDLRSRVQDAAAMHGPGAHEGQGHQGHHGEGGAHGLQIMQLPPAKAAASEIESGATIALVPVDANDKQALVDRARAGVDRMNNTPCR